MGADLASQVEEITRGFNAEADALIQATPRLVDWPRLRGIPAVGGCITDSVVPGSDKHLEELSA